MVPDSVYVVSVVSGMTRHADSHVGTLFHTNRFFPLTLRHIYGTRQPACMRTLLQCSRTLHFWLCALHIVPRGNVVLIMKDTCHVPCHDVTPICSQQRANLWFIIVGSRLYTSHFDDVTVTKYHC